MWQGVEIDLPDSRFIPFRTDHRWTVEDIQGWMQSQSEAALTTYKLHNVVALQVFLGIACLQWCLVSLLVPSSQPLSGLLIKPPFVVLAIKLVEVICIGWLLHVFENPSAVQSQGTGAVALFGNVGTSLKVWLTLLWFTAFVTVITVRFHEKSRYRKRN